MKFFVAIATLTTVVGFVAGAGLSESQKRTLRTYHEACIAESGVPNELVAKAKDRDEELVDDPKLKEYLFCLAKKIGILNDAGDIQRDVLKAKLGKALDDEAAAERFVNECAVKKDTPQNTAFDTIKCYRGKIPAGSSIF